MYYVGQWRFSTRNFASFKQVYLNAGINFTQPRVKCNPTAITYIFADTANA